VLKKLKTRVSSRGRLVDCYSGATRQRRMTIARDSDARLRERGARFSAFSRIVNRYLGSRPGPPERSDPSGSVPRPLERNSTSVRASTDVFARYIWIDRVGVETRGGGNRGRGFCPHHRAILRHVLFRVTHPLLDGHFPALPYELAHRDHAGNAHAAH